MDTDLLPPAVVFDCDGTLADTESLADHAWVDALRTRGYEVTDEDLTAVLGRPLPYCLSYFATRADLGDAEDFRSILATRFSELFAEGLELYDDALDTMRTLAEAGVRIAIASSSTRSQVIRVVERGGVDRHVSAIVGQEDVERHKPDPEPYLHAARLLDVDPLRCVAVEDSVVGVAAAVGAGMYTVGVLRRRTQPEALAAANLVVDRISVEALTPAGGRLSR